MSDLSSGEKGAGSTPLGGRERGAGFRAWRVLAMLLTLATIVWILRMVAAAWPDMVAHYREIDLLRLALALLLSVVASWFTFLAFAALLPPLGVSGYPLREAAHLYFTAQLFKHLPGRVWGIGYQWMAGGRATFGSWVQANVFHTMYATYFALWSSAIAIGISTNAVTAASIALTGGVFCILLWRLPMLSSALPWIGPLIRERLAGSSMRALATLPVADKLRILLLFALSWIVCYAAWYVNGTAYAPLGGLGGARMCAYYMLAWFIGYISLLTPSGLGVREVVFAWLGQDFPHDAIVLMAVVGRVSLLLVDLLLGLLFAPFAPRPRGAS